MFNRKKIERLEKDITKLGSMYLEIKNKSDIAFKNIIPFVSNKYLGKYYKTITKHSWNNPFLGHYADSTFIKVNSIYHNDNELNFNCTCIKIDPLFGNSIEEEKLTSIDGYEITEKEFQDAYTEYAISKGLLPKEDVSKKENNNKPKK